MGSGRAQAASFVGGMEKGAGEIHCSGCSSSRPTHGLGRMEELNFGYPTRATCPQEPHHCWLYIRVVSCATAGLKTLGEWLRPALKDEFVSFASAQPVEIAITSLSPGTEL